MSATFRLLVDDKPGMPIEQVALNLDTAFRFKYPSVSLGASSPVIGPASEVKSSLKTKPKGSLKTAYMACTLLLSLLPGIFLATLSHGLAVGGCNPLELLWSHCDMLRHEKAFRRGL
jgi:hypothetical protein